MMYCCESVGKFRPFCQARTPSTVKSLSIYVSHTASMNVIKRFENVNEERDLMFVSICSVCFSYLFFLNRNEIIFMNGFV